MNGFLLRADDGPCFVQEFYLHTERAPTLDKDKENIQNQTCYTFRNYDD